MIKKIAYLGLILFAFSCNDTSNGYTINATVDVSANDKSVQIYRMEGQQKIVQDSATVKAGIITLKGSVATPDLYFISVDGIAGSLPFILENTAMEVTFYKDSISRSLITGSKENDITKEYIAKSKFLKDINANIIKRYQKAQASKDPEAINLVKATYDSLITVATQFDKDFIKNNTNYVFSAIRLERLTKGKNPDKKEIESLYNLLPEPVKQSRVGKRIALFFNTAGVATKQNKAATPVAIGNVAPNFTGFTPEGKSLALKDIKAKVTIIDFWASWCRPCRVENPNVVKMYEKYKGKGLEIIGVSLDKNGQKDRWVNAIAKDGLTWPQVSNLKGWQEPIAVQYGVRSIPATFVLNEKGEIIASKLRGKALEDKVAELLN